MAYAFSLDDVNFLRSDDGRQSLDRAEQLPVTDSTLLADLTAARRFAGSQAASVIETIRLRRKAITKLGAVAANWLLTDEALQQASPWPVAQHRARRCVAGDLHGVHDATCSVGTDVAALAAAGCRVLVASDIDPVRAAMARHNLQLGAGSDAGFSGTSHRPIAGVVAIADALRPVSTRLQLYADPARRTGGRRITTAQTVPSVAELDAAYADRPAILRLPPGIDYDALARPGEVEIVSLAGVAREAVLWPPALSGRVRRRATVLADGQNRWQITDLDPEVDSTPCAAEPGEWIVDPDPAVVRAHLVRQYAARHLLRQLDPHLAYLCGPRPPENVRSFQVLDAAPFTAKVLAGWCRRDGVGTLEIKQRGTSVVPEQLRRTVRTALSGDTSIAATVVIARIGSSPTAFWCRAAEASAVAR